MKGKKYVITGGGSGIGRAAAEMAAAEGASVVILGRTEAKLEATVEAIGPAASYHVLDVTDGEAVKKVFGQIGAFDHLFTCASGITIGPFAELPEEAHRAFFETKFWGQYRAIRAALPHLARDGSITLMSGYLYRKPTPGYSVFAAVNGAIEALAKVLAIELAPIRVNALAPGQIDTLEAIIGPEANAGRKAAAADKLPLGRIGTPREAAHGALFLAQNTFSTGAVLDVDGGE